MSVPSSPSSCHASDGDAYDGFPGRGSSGRHCLLMEFARLPDEDEVLDVGCGTCHDKALEDRQKSRLEGRLRMRWPEWVACPLGEQCPTGV